MIFYCEIFPLIYVENSFQAWLFSTILNSATELTVLKHIAWVVIALSGSCPPWTHFVLISTCRSTCAATFLAICQHVVWVFLTFADRSPVLAIRVQIITAADIAALLTVEQHVIWIFDTFADRSPVLAIRVLIITV